MIFDPNTLYHQMIDIYDQNRRDANGKTQRVNINNEGGTRSSKTWDFFHFLVNYCDHNRNKENEIYLLRQSLVDCRDYTLKEFKKCLKKMDVWDSNNFTGSPKPYYNLFGNDCFFRGMEDEDDKEAYPSDIIFINEALETEKTQSAGLKMRCRKLFVKDWNPKYTQHWCFDEEGQPNTFFTHSTYLNNKHLEDSIITDIISYEPWFPGSYEVIARKLMYNGKQIDKNNQPPEHPENVRNNTANEFRWKVYGLGLRGAQEGVIFPNVVYDDAWPEAMDTFYGNDFGFTSDPNGLVEYAETETDIYVELLGYHPIETPTELNRFYESIGLDKEKLIIADSSDRFVSGDKGVQEFVRAMRLMDWDMRKVSKTKSVMFWLNSMKEKTIHIIMDKKGLWKKARIEQENYVMQVIHGHLINNPVDNNNHFWDPTRYCHMALNQESKNN